MADSIDISPDIYDQLMQRARTQACSVDELLQSWLQTNPIPPPSAPPEPDLYQLIVQHSRDVISVHRTDGTLIYGNPEAVQLSGYTLAELQAMSYDEFVALIHPDDLAYILQDEARYILSSQQIRKVQFRFKHKRGDYLWFETQSAPVLDAHNNTRYIIAVTRDITETKRAQEALQQSEARYQATMEAAIDAFYLLESVRDEAGAIVDFRIVEANQRASEQLGMPVDALIGGLICEMFPINRENGFFEQYKRVTETGEPLQQEFMIPSDYTAPGWYHHQVVKVQDGVAIVTRDITETKRAEQALHQSEYRLRSLIETQSAFVMRTDMQGNYTYTNRAYAERYRKYYGNPSSLIGLPSMDAVVPHEYEKTYRVIEQCIANPGQPHQITLQKQDPNSDDVAWTLWEFTAVTDADGLPQEIQCIGFDITANKQADDMRRENERLTLKFQQEQDRNALTQRIISALSHDMRNALTLISTSREILNRYHHKLSPEKRQEKLDTIQRQIDYALKLLDDTVQLARGNLDARQFTPTPMNLAALCRVSIDEVQAAYQTKHTMHLNNVGPIHIVVADEILISRILANLLSNAIKYSPDGGDIVLELSHLPDADGQKWVRLRVMDNGIGIADDDLPNIFDAFYRSSQAQFVGGTGLGLSIVRDCVVRHNGHIHVESTPGQGSTFMVDLPVG